MDATMIIGIVCIQGFSGIVMAAIKAMLIHIALDRYSDHLKFNRTRGYNPITGNYWHLEATNRPEARRKTRRALMVMRVINALMWCVVVLSFVLFIKFIGDLGAESLNAIAAMMLIPLMGSYVIAYLVISKVTGQGDEIQYLKS